MNMSSVATMIGCIALAVSSPSLGAYSQPAASLSSGGGTAVSAAYVNFGLLGLWSTGGASSAGFRNDSGFIPALGGWKILYPIVALNPSTLSFTLVSNGSGSKTVTVGNGGGSALQWSAAKAGPSGWLTLNPSSGSGGASLGVTASAVGLLPGTYTETVNVTGLGAEPASLLVTLSVGTGFQLTVSISAGPSFGSGTVNSIPPEIACPPICAKPFAAGSLVTLLATPSTGSSFGTWEGACSGSGSCVVTMDGPRSVVVNFVPQPATVSVSGDTTRYYTIGAALDAVASPGRTVSARNLAFTENVIMNSTQTIRLRGGFTDSSFSTRTATSSTVIDGTLKIRRGTLRVERLSIR